MGVEELAGLTGLDNDAAELARSRYATEPLIWNGGEGDRQLEEFRTELSARGLRLVRGGRFWHVMGNVDKADAVRFLLEKYRARHPDTSLISVALGDSPNDEEMLATADIAVVIPNPLVEAIRLPTHVRVIRPDAPGPTGWNQAVMALLDQYGF
jgi:mannosyl-3-phosphoglycerate phosphatase